jgi:hypothetical protein
VPASRVDGAAPSRIGLQARFIALTALYDGAAAKRPIFEMMRRAAQARVHFAIESQAPVLPGRI